MHSWSKSMWRSPLCKKRFVDMLRDGSLQISWLIFLQRKNYLKVYIFTYIILSWKHKYKKIAWLFILGKLFATDWSISPDEYSRQYFSYLPFPMDLAFGLLFHRLKTIFHWIKTVYCRDRNQQMQSKYSCSQSQGKLCSLTYIIHKHTNVGIRKTQRETRFPQESKHMVDGNDVIHP